MKLYTVYAKAGEEQKLDKSLFIAEGFSFWAFVFGPLWALYHRVWWLFFICIGVDVLMRMWLGPMGFPAQTTASMVALTHLAWSVLVGMFAHDWWRAALRRRGYALYDIVSGEKLSLAQRRYLHRQLAMQKPVRPSLADVSTAPAFMPV